MTETQATAEAPHIAAPPPGDSFAFTAPEDPALWAWRFPAVFEALPAPPPRWVEAIDGPHWTRKLTVADVREIRSLAAGGEPRQVIAARFGVGRSAVSKIVRRTRWASVA